jgi:pyruvate/2-oxoglutarate/acetoin dehydrogenase E1 component
MRELTYAQAISEALAIAMRKDASVYVAGEEIGVVGGSFLQTKGLYEEFGPQRVRDTPITETAIVGHAVGAAAAGLKPVVELMWVDFMGVCMDEVMNQAAKMRYMTGGKITLNLVIRAPHGAGFHFAAQHSQSLEALLTHIPGLKVVMPSTPRDAKGLLLSSIWDGNPIVFLEHLLLYQDKAEVPEGEYTIPLGTAAILREGKDVTVVSWSRMARVALAASQALANEGIQAEVIDLRTLIPYDKQCLLTSLRKTKRAVIVHEAVRTSGFGAEIAATLGEEGFDYLDAPIRRVGGADSPVPYSPVLETAFLPNEEKIVDAVKSLF